jgi:hypothetical protein
VRTGRIFSETIKPVPSLIPVKRALILPLPLPQLVLMLLLLLRPQLVPMLLSLSQCPKDRYLRPGLARRIRANPRWGIINRGVWAKRHRQFGTEALAAPVYSCPGSLT